ncbi:AsnC family transcriptional regulator [Haloplanus salilacus]|uniref:AsnC family transcriptional regulator n=1 Tax=Haloplanus salilacus TaxID=2949994 RepID=UPI0030CDF651
MRDLDETDLEILGLLMEDARRPWADIADAVDLSPPAVSDRVDRLRETGVIRGFTLDVDRSKLRDGVPVLVRVDPTSGVFDDVRGAFRDADAVEHVFSTAERDLVCHARVVDGDVPAWLPTVVDEPGAAIDDYTVTLLTGGEWTPTVDGVGFALTCAQCGNTVTSEGTSADIGGDVYQFCCPSCEREFRSRYDRFDAEAESGTGTGPSD